MAIVETILVVQPDGSFMSRPGGRISGRRYAHVKGDEAQGWLILREFTPEEEGIRDVEEIVYDAMRKHEKGELDAAAATALVAGRLAAVTPELRQRGLDTIAGKIQDFVNEKQRAALAASGRQP